jgi:GTP cyclohydrolase II
VIIRSFSRSAPSFHQLLAYLHRDGRTAGASLLINLPLPHAEPETAGLRDLSDAFLANARRGPARKNGVSLYHEIISLSAADAGRVTPETLLDLARFYLERRAPGAPAYAVVHLDTPHPHCHLVIAAHLPHRGRKLRLSRAQFDAVKRELEAYQRERYPELAHSVVFRDRDGDEDKERDKGGRRRPAVRETPAEKERAKRLRGEGRATPSRKDRLRDAVLAALTGAVSPEHFQDRLRARGLPVYLRNGRLTGILHAGKKYRFSTLGLADAIATADRRWRQLPRRQQALSDILAEKARQRVRRLGVPDRIRHVLERGEETETERQAEREREGESARKDGIRRILEKKHQIRQYDGGARGPEAF